MCGMLLWAEIWICKLDFSRGTPHDFPLPYTTVYYRSDSSSSSELELMSVRPDNDESIRALSEGVQNSIGSIERGVRAFVFDGVNLTYANVAVELRKLLADRNAVNSYQKDIGRARNAKNLFELRFGNMDQIYVGSFALEPSPDSNPVTPPVHYPRIGILQGARDTLSALPATLNHWLTEFVCYDSNYKPMNVVDAIKHVAGREGSHAINPAKDRRLRLGFTVSVQSQTGTGEQLECDDGWQHLIIGAGMRLLLAEDSNGRPLIQHDIDIPPSTGGL